MLKHLWPILGLAACMVIWLLVTVLNESALIIQLGVRLFTALRLAAILVLIACGVVVFWGLFQTSATKAREMEELARQTAEENRYETSDSYANESLTPDSIRGHLERLGRRNPGLRATVERGLEQMDQMDSYQARLHRLLNMNEAEYLRNTEAVLDDVEIYLCKNLRNVINFCIVAGGDDGDAYLSASGEAAAKRNLAENDQTLQTVQKFLDYATNLVNDRNSGDAGYPDFKVLENWIETIRASLKEVV